MARKNKLQIYVVLTHSKGRIYTTWRYHGTVAHTKTEAKKRYSGGFYGIVDRVYTVEEARALTLGNEEKKEIESEIAFVYKLNRDILEDEEQ